MNSSFSAAVPLRASFQKLLLKRTTAGSLSTTSLTFVEVLLSMIVLPSAQVLHDSSAGMASRSAAKASAASKAGFVCAACLVVGVLFFCAADFSLRRIDCLCVWPDECISFSAAAVSRLVTTLPSSGSVHIERLFRHRAAQYFGGKKNCFESALLPTVVSGLLRRRAVSWTQSTRRGTQMSFEMKASHASNALS
jgi:hypothetical protein